MARRACVSARAASPCDVVRGANCCCAAGMPLGADRSGWRSTRTYPEASPLAIRSAVAPLLLPLPLLLRCCCRWSSRSRFHFRPVPPSCLAAARSRRVGTATGGARVSPALPPSRDAAHARTHAAQGHISPRTHGAPCAGSYATLASMPFDYTSSSSASVPRREGAAQAAYFGKRVACVNARGAGGSGPHGTLPARRSRDGALSLGLPAARALRPQRRAQDDTAVPRLLSRKDAVERSRSHASTGTSNATDPLLRGAALRRSAHHRDHRRRRARGA